MLSARAMRKWVLPDYVEDVLPPEAQRMEATRRALLDSNFAAAGYALVNPPLIEHLEPCSPAPAAIEHNTFKLIDPLSGKLLGVRPDITPQVARIDATYSGSDTSTPRRYCYAGEVLRAEASIGSSRALTQVGAELFGDATVSGRRGNRQTDDRVRRGRRRCRCCSTAAMSACSRRWRSATNSHPKATQAADAALAAKSSTALATSNRCPTKPGGHSQHSPPVRPGKTVLQRARRAAAQRHDHRRARPARSGRHRHHRIWRAMLARPRRPAGARLSHRPRLRRGILQAPLTSSPAAAAMTASAKPSPGNARARPATGFVR